MARKYKVRGYGNHLKVQPVFLIITKGFTYENEQFI